MNIDTQSIPKMLDSLRVLVCRPEPGATELMQVLTSVGASCLKLPMLETEAEEPSQEMKQVVMDLDAYQHVIVVSQHAANIGMELIESYWPQFPVQQNWYPIGRKTASVLNEFGVNCAMPNGDLTSEALVQELGSLTDIGEERVLLLKGKGGRDLIRQKLGKKAKQFDELELYERVMPQYDLAETGKELMKFDPDFVVALSGETLNNLISLSKSINIDLSGKSFILSSDRVANIAYEAGIKNVFIPENLMPIDIIKCLNKALKVNAAKASDKN